MVELSASGLDGSVPSVGPTTVSRFGSPSAPNTSPMPMADCPVCAEKIKHGVAVCRSCGAILDREKAAQIGLTTGQIGASLGALLGGGYVNYFSMQTRSYRVIPQVERVSRLNVDQLLDYPVASICGVPVPLWFPDAAAGRRAPTAGVVGHA